MRLSVIAGSLLAAALLAACGNDSTGFENPLETCTTAVDVTTIPDSINATLAEGDCELEEDSTYLDLYRLTVAAEQRLRVTMRSDEVDPFLFVFDEAGDVIETNDDIRFPGDTDAEIVRTFQPGTYYIGANEVDPNDAGPYSLVIRDPDDDGEE